MQTGHFRAGLHLPLALRPTKSRLPRLPLRSVAAHPAHSSSCTTQLAQRRLPTRCATGIPPEGRKGGFFSSSRGKKQDDARKQLQDLFKDKPDMLATYDAGGGSGSGKGGKGGGGGRGGGGGGSGDWRNFDWRAWGRSSLQRLQASLRSIGAALGALLLFGGIIILVSFGPAALGFLVGILRRVLRLGGSGRQRPKLQPAHQHEDDGEEDELALGGWERQMIAKYGPVANSGQQEPRKTAAAA